MIDWKAKLTSRKFWMAIAGFVTGIVAFIQHPTSDAQAISGLIMAFGSVVAYIIGEGLADAAAANNPVIVKGFDEDDFPDDDDDYEDEWPEEEDDEE